MPPGSWLSWRTSRPIATMAADRQVSTSVPRHDKPLIKLNCAALPAGLVESELFGHEKGAFSGAIQRRIGRFELANGGTIFLDEIGEVPMDVQVTLLTPAHDLTLEPDSDAAILAAIRAGDDAGYEALIRCYGPRLRVVARRFLGSDHDVDDAIQEAFISAFRAMPRFEGTATLATWLHRIVINACLMKLRSQSRRRTTSIEELLPTFDGTGHYAAPVSPWVELGALGAQGAQADQQHAREETRAQVRACIDQLPVRYRTVLLLRDIEELDTDQTAAVLGISPGAVKTRLHRARQALRGLLEPLFMAP